MVVIVTQLYSGVVSSQNQIGYLRWVDSQLPKNAIVLAGGKSDLVTLGENIKKPIVYSALWNAAILIKPNEIPGVKPTDFGIGGVLFLYKGPLKMRATSSSDFNIIAELKNKNNFKRNKYIILEDDVYIWRGRLTGTGDGVFTTGPKSTTALHGDDYSIKVYKSNPTLKKAIYELNIQDKKVN